MTELPLLVGQLHSKLDAALSSSRARFAQVPTRCQSGCDACCHYPVQATLVEAYCVYRALDPGRMAAVRAYRDAYLARLDERGEPQDEEAEALLAWGLPCPLLEGGRCTAYETRPIACRACHSYSDPALCNQVRANVLRDPGSREVAVQALELAIELEVAVSLPHRTTLLPFLLYALDREPGDSPEAKLSSLSYKLR